MGKGIKAKPLKIPKRKVFNIVMPLDLIQTLKKIANYEAYGNVSLLVRTVLENYAKKKIKKNNSKRLDLKKG